MKAFCAVSSLFRCRKQGSETRGDSTLGTLQIQVVVSSKARQFWSRPPGHWILPSGVMICLRPFLIMGREDTWTVHVLFRFHYRRERFASL